MKKFPRFMRQIGKAGADFPMIKDGDKFLVPIDADYSHLCLVALMQQKNIVLKDSRPMSIIHFHTTETPSAETTAYLDIFCKKRNIEYSTKYAPQINDHESHRRVLLETAIDLNCNKVCLPDSLDYLDALILTNMAFEAAFSGLSVIEPHKIGEKNVEFIRPFCYLTDEEITKAGEKNEFPNSPTGVILPENENMAISRRAICHFLDGMSNIRMNFFNAQYNVQKKYIGKGEITPLDDESIDHYEDDVDFDHL